MTVQKMKWYNNGINEHKYEEGTQPEGWILGRLLNYYWITNGVEEIHISKSDPIPSGYTRGRVKKFKGKKIYHKDNIQIMCFPGEEPKGFILGVTDAFKEHLKDISHNCKGIIRSEKQKKEHSLFLKEYYKDKTNHPMYGKHHSEYARQLISKALTGKPSQNKGVKYSEEKKTIIKQNITNKYGSLEVFYQTLDQKQKQTKLERYGNPNYNNVTKSKQTCLERYGVDSPLKSESIKEKSKQTCLEKYGSTSYCNSQLRKDRLNNLTSDELDKIKQKRYNTMRMNDSFNKSKLEDLYYEYLLSIYDENDIIRQYKSILYPFNCDFYIKSQDLYIECNYSWTHGGHRYNPNSIKDNVKLADWSKKATTSNYYKNAIYTWTNLDIRKEKVARKNNLNYKVIYSLVDDEENS